MRSVFILTTAVVLGVLVSTTQGTIIATRWNPDATAPTLNGADTDACWTVPTKYPEDGLYDNFYGNAGNLNEVARVDFHYVRMCHDNTNLYIHIQWNTARNITTGSNANDAWLAFDIDRSITTGYNYPAQGDSTFGSDIWISAMNPSATTYLDKYTTQNPPGGIVHAMTFGTTTRAYGKTGTYYTSWECKIPWTTLGVTDLANYQGFYWIAGENAGRGCDYYPDCTDVPGSTNGADYHFARDYFMYSPIPEPSTLALLAAGLAGLMAYAWRKR